MSRAEVSGRAGHRTLRMTGEDAEGRAGEERHLEAPMSAHRSRIGKSVDGRHEVQQRLPLSDASPGPMERKFKNWHSCITCTPLHVQT